MFQNADERCEDLAFTSTSSALTAVPTTVNKKRRGKLSPDITGKQLFPPGRKLFQGLYLPIHNLIAYGIADVYNHGLQTFLVRMYKALDISIYGEHILYLRTALCL